MRITYNAPVILTFTIACLLIKLVDNFLGGTLVPAYFVLPGNGQFHFHNWLDDIRMISYAFGHIDWLHLVGNFYVILLIGPILEEKYGSARLLMMMLLTILITALLHVFLFSEGLLGASGIVFMLILLTPFAGAKAGTIPLTFIMVALLYLSQEFFNILKQDNISQFAHVAGGLLGSLFGFLSIRQKGASPSARTSGVKTTDDWLKELGDTTLQSKT